MSLCKSVGWVGIVLVSVLELTGCVSRDRAAEAALAARVQHQCEEAGLEAIPILPAFSPIDEIRERALQRKDFVKRCVAEASRSRR